MNYSYKILILLFAISSSNAMQMQLQQQELDNYGQELEEGQEECKPVFNSVLSEEQRDFLRLLCELEQSALKKTGESKSTHKPQYQDEKVPVIIRGGDGDKGAQDHNELPPRIQALVKKFHKDDQLVLFLNYSEACECKEKSDLHPSAEQKQSSYYGSLQNDIRKFTKFSTDYEAEIKRAENPDDSEYLKTLHCASDKILKLLIYLKNQQTLCDRVLIDYPQAALCLKTPGDLLYHAKVGYMHLQHSAKVQSQLSEAEFSDDKLKLLWIKVLKMARTIRMIEQNRNNPDLENILLKLFV